jgi:hypothetical protein
LRERSIVESTALEVAEEEAEKERLRREWDKAEAPPERHRRHIESRCLVYDGPIQSLFRTRCSFFFFFKNKSRRGYQGFFLEGFCAG